MQAHEILQQAGPGFAASILGFFREHERNVYKTTLATLAQGRNLRPVFIQQKPAPAQIEWMGRELAHRRGDSMAEQVLQVWLMRARTPMLVKFVEALGIAHDGKGAVDDLPDSFEADRLQAAVDGLLAEFDAREVAVYLHVFQMQRPGGWPELAAILAEDPRLALGHPEDGTPKAEENS